tara:strand:+ start:285 stop:527 length:243 start_codon:yes stop_codon:yes gene_type:complete
MRIFRKLIGSDIGRILLSIILGLGLSAIFKKTCDNRSCLVFESPPLDELREKTYEYNKKCYQFAERQVKCDKKKQKVNFA